MTGGWGETDDEDAGSNGASCDADWVRAEPGRRCSGGRAAWQGRACRAPLPLSAYAPTVGSSPAATRNISAVCASLSLSLSIYIYIHIHIDVHIYAYMYRYTSLCYI